MNKWISVEDRLPEIDKVEGRASKTIRVLCACKQKSGKVMVKEGYCIIYDPPMAHGNTYWKIPGSIDSVTHWMYLPEPPKEEDGLNLVNSSTMLWVGGEPFRCCCGSNVFSEYQTNNGKRVFECHGCRSKYEGE